MSDTQTTNVTPDSSTTRNRRSDKKSSKTGKIAAAVIVVYFLPFTAVVFTIIPAIFHITH